MNLQLPLREKLIGVWKTPFRTCCFPPRMTAFAGSSARLREPRQVAFRPLWRSLEGGRSATLTAQVRPLLSYAGPGPNDRVGQRSASGSLAAGLVICQRISRSPAVVPAASASTTHCGLRPRRDLVGLML